jgi:hypothetical protein
MKNPPRHKTKTSPKISAPDIAAATGREYRDIAESTLATATPDELKQLVLLFVTYADGLQHQIQDRNLLISRLIDLGRDLEQVRRANSKVFNTTAKMLGRALSPSDLTDRDLREDYLKAASAGLDEQARIGFAPIDWPDKSTYASSERMN